MIQVLVTYGFWPHPSAALATFVCSKHFFVEVEGFDETGLEPHVTNDRVCKIDKADKSGFPLSCSSPFR